MFTARHAISRYLTRISTGKHLKVAKDPSTCLLDDVIHFLLRSVHMPGICQHQYLYISKGHKCIYALPKYHCCPMSEPRLPSNCDVFRPMWQSILATAAGACIHPSVRAAPLKLQGQLLVAPRGRSVCVLGRSGARGRHVTKLVRASQGK